MQQIKAIDNAGFLNPIGATGFGSFVPSVTWSLSGTNLTVTDASTYDSDEAFTKVNVTVSDYNGKTKSDKISISGGNVVIDCSTLVNNGGYNLMVRVIASEYLAVGTQLGIGAEAPATGTVQGFERQKTTGVQNVI